MELCRQDFDTVLVAEGGFGPVDRRLARENPVLVECEECSTKKHAVFHNRNGHRPHISESELAKNIDRAMWNLDS
jgi:hypothetical protein